MWNRESIAPFFLTYEVDSEFRLLILLLISSCNMPSIRKCIFFKDKKCLQKEENLVDQGIQLNMHIGGIDFRAIRRNIAKEKRLEKNP